MRLAIDFVALRFDLNRIESSVRLICDYALTGGSDSMEIMSLNFAWIRRLTLNYYKKRCSVFEIQLRIAKSSLGRGSYNY